MRKLLHKSSLIFILILSMFLCACSVTKKASSKTLTDTTITQYRDSSSLEQTGTRIDKFDRQDSAVESTKDTRTREIVLSTPDSAGKQYPIVIRETSTRIKTKTLVASESRLKLDSLASISVTDNRYSKSEQQSSLEADTSQERKPPRGFNITLIFTIIIAVAIMLRSIPIVSIIKRLFTLLNNH